MIKKPPDLSVIGQTLTVGEVQSWGDDLVPPMPGYVCPKVKDVGVFWLQWSKMSKNNSLKMGVKLALWLNMSKNVC